MIITFPDGNTREFADGLTGLEIANEISPRLAKATLSCSIDGVHYRDVVNDVAVQILLSLIQLLRDAKP